MLIQAIVLGLLAQAPGSTRWTFDKDPYGAIADGFSNEAGKWVVVSERAGKGVLMQTAGSPSTVFNLALAAKPRPKDLELTVSLHAIAGKEDQGGGLVWRARDASNYYVTRYNPLEDNFRLYKVVAGKRTQLATADVKLPPGWHKLTVRMEGDHITCSLDGKVLLNVRDSTFPDAGKVGLWTKADARTEFDDLLLVEPAGG